MGNTSQKGDNRAEKLKFAVLIGTIGGLFWPFLSLLAYYMNFSLIGPSIFIRPFILSSFADKPAAHLLGVVAAVILSNVVSILYVYTLSRFYQPWIGVGLGLVLFGLFYYVINPLFALTKKPLHDMGWNTFSTQICLFVLYGLFIGFSLSAEFSSKEAPAK